jgi:hypothetical protein
VVALMLKSSPRILALKSFKVTLIMRFHFI